MTIYQKKNIDVPYVCGMNEEEKQKWIEEKIIFLEEAYQQKVISVDENNDSITFIFETEYMSPKVQFEKASYSKICDK